MTHMLYCNSSDSRSQGEILAEMRLMEHKMEDMKKTIDEMKRKMALKANGVPRAYVVSCTYEKRVSHSEGTIKYTKFLSNYSSYGKYLFSVALFPAYLYLT